MAAALFGSLGYEAGRWYVIQTLNDRGMEALKESRLADAEHYYMALDALGDRGAAGWLAGCGGSTSRTTAAYGSTTTRRYFGSGDRTTRSPMCTFSSRAITSQEAPGSNRTGEKRGSGIAKRCGSARRKRSAGTKRSAERARGG